MKQSFLAVIDLSGTERENSFESPFLFNLRIDFTLRDYQDTSEI